MRHLCRGLCISLVAALLVISAMPALAAAPFALPPDPPQTPPAQDSALASFIALFPELGALPAPSWVQPGWRVTYYDSSASIAQIADEEGSAGAGLTQYDVVARERRTIPLVIKLYLDKGDGTFQASFTTGAAAPAGAGEFWINPIALRRADDLDLPDLQVTRVPYEVAGETFDAVRFDYVTDESESAWVFDSKTGLLLFSRSSVEGVSHDQLANRTLVGMRELDIPWEAGSPPRGLSVGDEIEFGGAQSSGFVGEPATLALPLAATIDVVRARSSWTMYRTESFLNNLSQGAATQITGGLQLFDAYWLPASALEADPPDPVIDRDPYTGAEIAYSRRGSRVTLTETGSGYEYVLVYDRNGQLSSWSLTTEVSPMVVVSELQRME